MKKGFLIAAGIVLVVVIVFRKQLSDWLTMPAAELDSFQGAPRGITSVVHDNGQVLGESIAGVDRKTGTMYVNVPMVDKMKLGKDELVFIMLHEMGHMVLQTSDERAVDQWAHREYLRRGYSPKKSVYALTNILRFNKREDFDRSMAQLNRAQLYDNGQKNI